MKQMGRFLAGVLIMCLMLGVAITPKAWADTPSHPFTDMVGSRYETVVASLYEIGVVSGLEPDKFVPDGPVTRAQMAALIIRAMGKSADAQALMTVKSEFTDVPNDHWARGVIALAHRSGIIKGDGSRFFPNDPVNYAQAATMLVRALGYESQVTGGYPSGYIITANDLHLLDGLFNYEVYAGVNRAEAAVMLYNAVYKSPQASTKLTWSQSIFQRAKTLSFGNVPAYVAPGQQITLDVVAADREGKELPDAMVSLRVVSGNGTIQGKNLTAGDGGAIMIQASLGSLSAVTTVTPVSNLSITPDTFQANKGGTVQLSASAMSGGQKVTVRPEWRVKSGPATITQQGLLTVTDYGTVTVEAALGNLRATATGQAVGKVTITNKPQYFVPGNTYNLGAVVSDPAGRQVNVPVTWTAVGATIDSATGRLTGATANQVVVRATAGGTTDEATIPVLKSISVTPASTSLLIGRTATFTAKGVDSAGQQYPIDVQWSRSNPAVGIISNDGTFAATGNGSTNIVATAGSLSGTATLSVAGQPARLTATTSSASVPVGGNSTVTVTVKLQDAIGNLTPLDDQPISFTLSGAGSLSKAVALTQKGEASVVYTPGTTASVASVSVSAPGISLGTQAVTISSYSPVPNYIQLSVTPQPLAASGGTATVTATVRDAYGFPATTAQTLSVTLVVSGGYVGSLTSPTITIPAGQSSGTTSFISGGVPGVVQVNGTSTYQVRGTSIQTSTVGPAAGVKIRPIAGPTPVTGVSSLVVQVEVRDAAGVTRAQDNGSQISLTVSGLRTGGQDLPAATYTAPSVSGVATFSIPAYAVGTANLTAALKDVPGATTDTATAEFVPGIFSSLRLTATPATIQANGVSQSQIVAEVVDRSNTVVNSINPLVTFKKLVDGGATVALSDLNVQAVNGRAVLTVRSTGANGTDTWYATAPGLEAQNLATVSTSLTGVGAQALRVTGNATFALNTVNTLTVQVVDAQGNAVMSDQGRVITVNHSIPGVVFTPTQVTTVNGQATFTVYSTQATSGVATFSTTGLATPFTTVSLGFGTGASTGTAQSLRVSGGTNFPLNSVQTLTVQVIDAYGNVVTSDSGRTITANYSIPGVVVTPSQAITSSGQAMFNVYGTQTTSGTITFSTTGLATSVITTTVSFASGYSGGGIAQGIRISGNTTFTVNSAGTLTVEVVDANGFVVSSDNGRAITVSQSIPGVVISPPTAVTANGVATFYVSSTQAGSGSVTFTTTGLQIPTALGSLSFTASQTQPGGTAYTIRVAGNTSYGLNTPGMLTVQVIDMQGNVVTSDNGRYIAVTHSIPGLSVTPAATTTVNGVAVFSVTGSQAASGSIMVTGTGLPLPAASAIVTVGTGSSSGNPSGSAVALQANGSYGTARIGQPVTVTVRVVDSLGQTITSDSGRTISVQFPQGTVSMSPQGAFTVNGQATFTITPLALSNSLTVTFSSPGLTPFNYILSVTQ